MFHNHSKPLNVLYSSYLALYRWTSETGERKKKKQENRAQVKEAKWTNYSYTFHVLINGLRTGEWNREQEHDSHRQHNKTEPYSEYILKKKKKVHRWVWQDPVYQSFKRQQAMHGCVIFAPNQQITLKINKHVGRKRWNVQWPYLGFSKLLQILTLFFTPKSVRL